MTLRPRLVAVVAALVLLTGCGDDGSDPPSRSAWTTVPPAPLSARHGAVGAWLDGRFVLVGGDSGPACPANASCAEPAAPPRTDGATFEPSTGRWRMIAPAPRPVGGTGEAVVAGGRLYVPSSSHSRAGRAVLLSYDPARDRWAEHPLPPGESSQLVGVGRRVVSVGWSDEQTRAVDAVLDPGTDRWRQLPDDPLGPSFDRSAARLGDGLLLTAKDLVADPGAVRPSLTRLAVLDRTLTRWTTLPDSAIIGGSPTPVADRVVFPETGSADGGEIGNWGRPYPFGGILDPATGTWTPLPEPPETRTGVDRPGTVGDRTLVGGHLLDPVTLAWTPLPRAPWNGERTGHTILTSPDRILVWGGASGTANVAEGYLLSP